MDLDAAFGQVVAEHERAVYTTALHVTGTPADAEDLAAETFLRAYAAARRYSDERWARVEWRPWLVTICLNQWRNQVRAASRRPATSSVPSERASTDETPEQHAERRDQASRLAEVLRQLPERQRLAVVLRHAAGLSYAEVGVVLACPEGTAKSHVSRGIDRLRALTPGGLQ